MSSALDVNVRPESKSDVQVILIYRVSLEPIGLAQSIGKLTIALFFEVRIVILTYS